MSEFEFIKYSVANGIARLVLSRPEKLNAFHLPMYEEMSAAFGMADEDDDVHVLLLSAEGRAFCAGRDFTYSATLAESEGASAWRKRYKLLVRETILARKMSIALVRGYALGGGSSIALGADITIAAEGTQFGYPEARHGPASKSHMWSWFLGRKGANEMVMTGRFLPVEEALDRGLVNHVVPDTELESTGELLARAIADAPTGVPELTKRYVNYAYRDLPRVTFLDRAFDIDTAAWDTAGSEPSPWLANVRATRAAFARGSDADAVSTLSPGG